MFYILRTFIMSNNIIFNFTFRFILTKLNVNICIKSFCVLSKSYKHMDTEWSKCFAKTGYIKENEGDSSLKVVWKKERVRLHSRVYKYTILHISCPSENVKTKTKLLLSLSHLAVFFVEWPPCSSFSLILSFKPNFVTVVSAWQLMIAHNVPTVFLLMWIFHVKHLQLHNCSNSVALYRYKKQVKHRFENTMEHTHLEQRAVQNEGPLKIPVSERRGLNLIHPCQGSCNSQLYLGQLKQTDATQHRAGHKKLIPSPKWSGNLRRGEGRRHTGRMEEGMSGQTILQVAGGEGNWHGYQVQQS